MPRISASAAPLPAKVYRRVLRDAVSVAWRHKHLWPFGLLTMLIGFGGVADTAIWSYQHAVGFVSTDMAQGGLAAALPWVATVRLYGWYAERPALTGTAFVLSSVLLYALAWALATPAIGALIFSVRKIARGGEPEFSEGLRAGRATFGPVLLVNLLARVAIWTALLITGLYMAILIAHASPLAMTLYVLSFVVLTAFAMSASVVAIFASQAVVAEKLSGREALARGINVFGRHWLASLEFSAVLFALTVAAGFVAVVAFLIAAIPLLFLFIVAATLKSAAGMTAVYALTVAALVAAGALLIAALSTFQTAAWTLLWQEFSHGGAVAKLLRLAAALRRRIWR